MDDVGGCGACYAAVSGFWVGSVHSLVLLSTKSLCLFPDRNSTYPAPLPKNLIKLILYLDLSAGMSLEDGAVLGECLSRISSKSASSKCHALKIYEECRKSRTEMVVQRGNLQQYLYHLHDGSEQEERDRMMRMSPTPKGEALAWRDPDLAPRLLGYCATRDVSCPSLISI